MPINVKYDVKEKLIKYCYLKILTIFLQKRIQLSAVQNHLRKLAISFTLKIGVYLCKYISNDK